MADLRKLFLNEANDLDTLSFNEISYALSFCFAFFPTPQVEVFNREKNLPEVDTAPDL